MSPSTGQNAGVGKLGFLGLLVCSGVLAILSSAEPQTGVPSNAYPMPYTMESPEPKNQGFFGGAMDAAWPFLVIGERGVNLFTNPGIIRVWYVEDEFGVTPDNLTLIGEFSPEVDESQIWEHSGALLSLATTRPGEEGHIYEEDEMTGWILWVGGARLYNTAIRPDGDGGWYLQYQGWMEGFGVCSGEGVIQCEAEPRALGWNGHSFLASYGDGWNTWRGVWNTNNSFTSNLSPDFEDPEDQEFGNSLGVTKHEYPLLLAGAPKFSTSILTAVGQVELYDDETNEAFATLSYGSDNPSIERNQFGSAIACPDSQHETAFVVSAQFNQPSMHVFNSVLLADQWNPTEKGYLWDPFQDGKPLGSALAAEVWRRNVPAGETPGPGKGDADMFVVLGSNRYGVDRVGFLQLYKVDDLDNFNEDEPRRLINFYGPGAGVTDDFARSVATMIEPKEGNIWIFASAPGTDLIGNDGDEKLSAGRVYVRVYTQAFPAGLLIAWIVGPLAVVGVAGFFGYQRWKAGQDAAAAGSNPEQASLANGPSKRPIPESAKRNSMGGSSAGSRGSKGGSRRGPGGSGRGGSGRNSGSRRKARGDGGSRGGSGRSKGSRGSRRKEAPLPVNSGYSSAAQSAITSDEGVTL